MTQITISDEQDCFSMNGTKITWMCDGKDEQQTDAPNALAAYVTIARQMFYYHFQDTGEASSLVEALFDHMIAVTK